MRRFVQAFAGFRHNCMETLVVKVHLDRVSLLQNTVQGAVVLVQEEKGSLVAGFTLHISAAVDLLQIDDIDIDIDMRAVDPVGAIAGNAVERGIALVVADVDFTNLFKTSRNALFGAFFVSSYVPLPIPLRPRDVGPERVASSFALAPISRERGAFSVY